MQVESDAHSEFIPTFWEDDYCQIEIIPSENESFIRSQIIAIENFQENLTPESGIEYPFERALLPFPTLTREIRIDYLESTLISFLFLKAKHIRYDEKLLETSNAQTAAFYLTDFPIFFDFEAEFVKNIWLSISNTKALPKKVITTTLYDLGECNDFILIDWNSLTLVDLRDETQIHEYLSNYSTS